MKKGQKIEVPYFGLDFNYLGVSPFDKTKVEFSIEKPFLPLNKYPSFYTYFEEILKSYGGDKFDLHSYQTRLVFELPKKGAEDKVTTISEKFNILLGLFNKDNVLGSAEKINDARIIYFFWKFKIGLYKSNVSNAYILYLNSPIYNNKELSETIAEFIRKSLFSINSAQTKDLGNNEYYVVFEFDPFVNLSQNDLVDFIYWLQDKYETYSKNLKLGTPTQNLQPYFLLPKSDVQIYSIEKTPYYTFAPKNIFPLFNSKIEEFARTSLPLNDFPSFIKNQDNSWTFTMGNISLAKQESYFEKLDDVLSNLISITQSSPTPQAITSTFPPKEFMVESEDTSDFKDYVEFLNKNYGTSYNRNDKFDFYYYGVEYYKGKYSVMVYNNYKDFINIPIFTAKEFMDNLRASQMPTSTQPTSTFPPKFFAVENDKSPEFQEFLKWLNKSYGTSYNGSATWYGYDEDNDLKAVNNDNEFKGNPILFTPKVFMDNLRASQSSTTPQSSSSTFPPKYFAVENDGSKDFKEFIAWFSKKYNNNYSGTSLWYGFDETENERVVSDLQRFKGNPQVFTAKEFMDNLRATQMPKQEEVITKTKKIKKSNDYSQQIDQLKKQIAEAMFLKSIISPIEFEKRIELEQSISKKQKEINELNFKTFEEKFDEGKVFDELFEQSFVEIQHDYNNFYSSGTDTEFSDLFTPNGKVSKYSDEINELIRTPQFIEWFGDWELAYQYKDVKGLKFDCSKVLNENYEPQIVWHGTGGEFSYFKYDTFPASYFAVNKSYAKWFADLHGGDEGYVLPFFLNVKNPLDLTHFGTREISSKDFFDYMYLQTGLDMEGLEINPIFADSSFRPVETWVYLRNNPKMLKKISELKIFDGIHFYETNPSVPTGENAHETEVWITFRPDQAKLADPSRGTILMASLKSFILKRGGKI